MGDRVRRRILRGAALFLALPLILLAGCGDDAPEAAETNLTQQSAATGNSNPSAMIEAMESLDWAEVGRQVNANPSFVHSSVGGTGWTALHFAAESGQMKVATFLLSKGADLERRDGAGSTALFVAAEAGQMEMVRFLLEREADPNTVSLGGQTLLHLAAARGDVDLGEILFSESGDKLLPNRVNRSGQTPLHLAILGHHDLLLAYLINQKVELNVPDLNNDTPLRLAVEQGMDEQVEQLLSRGAKPAPVAPEVPSLLEVTVERRDRKTARVLLKYKLDPNRPTVEKVSLLRLATQNEDWVMATELVQAGAALDQPQDDGWLPLPWGVQHGPLAFVEACLKNKASMTARSLEGRSLLRLVAERGDLAIAKRLLAAKADPNAPEGDGGTPLVRAALGKRLEMTRLFLDHGADPEVRVGGSQSLLHALVDNGRSEFVQALIAKGAKVNTTKGGGLTPLHSAAVAGDAKMVALLIAAGARVNELSGMKNTALQMAAFRNRAAVVGLLIKAGADLNLKGQGGTALMAALQAGSGEAAERLVAAGANLQGSIVVAKLSLDVPHRAAFLGLTGVIEQLLARRVAVDAATPKEGWTLLHMAASQGYLETVQFLLKNKANPNLVAKNRRTALHFAAENGHLAVVKALVAGAAAVNRRDSRGETPLGLALRKKKPDVVAFLQKKGGRR